MNVLHGALGIIKATFNIDVVESRKQLDRLLICASCNQRDGRRCKHCGCFLKSKTKLLNEKCTEGKW